MQRPIVDPVKIAKSSLRAFCGLPAIFGIKFHGTLADITDPARVAEHFLEEPSDKSRHADLPLV